MILFDAYPLIAFVKGERGAVEVRQLLETGEPATITVLGLAEVYDSLVRGAGLSHAVAALEIARVGLDAPPALEMPVAIRVGLLRARHYHRTRRNISMADCVAAETARDLGARLATSDPHLLDMCAQEGIEVIALPDSGGVLWERTT
jgi:PIN domain nuclease of toxin-antitoxin system